MAAAKTAEVYGQIADVIGDLAEVGIGKEGRNQQQGFTYRGIDQFFNALAPVLAKRKLAFLPRVLSRTCEARTTKTGGALYCVVLEVEYDIVSVVDGSTHTVKVYGEAMDLADKATNKAMSAAYKYAAMQAFCVPFDPVDADETTPPDTVPVKAATKAASVPSPSQDASQLSAEIGLQLDAATDDVAALSVSRAIMANRSRLPVKHAKELAKRALSMRAELVPASAFGTFTAQAESVVKAKLVEQADADVLIASAKARLNMQ